MDSFYLDCLIMIYVLVVYIFFCGIPIPYKYEAFLTGVVFKLEGLSGFEFSFSGTLT